MNFLSHKISTHSGLILVVIANDTALSNLRLPLKVPLTHLKQRAITKSLNSGLHSPQNTESQCQPSMRSEALTLYVSYKCVCPLPQSCLTLCDPMACSPPGSCAMGFSSQEYCRGCHFLLQGSSWPRDQTYVSWIGRRVLYHTATCEAMWIWFESSCKKKKSEIGTSLVVRWLRIYLVI